MKLVDTRGITDPFVNLAIEDYLLHNANTAKEDLLLLYVNEPSIIIGRNQNIYREVNFEFLRNGVLKIARRITGGGAVYHDMGNLNFAFITSFNDKKINNYPLFNAPLIKAFTKAGIDLKTDERNNITCRGKKVSGNAQFTNRKNIISHGTLLFNANLATLRACLKPNDFEVETKAVASVPSPVMNLAEATNKFATVNALKDFLVKELAYMNTLELNTDDWDSINHLARAKFETYEWIYGRSPKATINKPGLEIQVEDGTITAITIDKLPATEVEMLRGLRYEFTEIKKALAPLANAQNILQLIF